jgi:hypothetical protein
MRKALLAALLLATPSIVQAQWTMTGGGDITQTSLAGIDLDTQAQVQPDCGTNGQFYICDIDWLWQAHNWVLTGPIAPGNFVRQGGRVIDNPSTYEVAAFVENTQDSHSFWTMRVKVIHKDLTNPFGVTELLNIVIASHLSAPGGQYMTFSSGYGGQGCNRYCTVYAFKYSPDGVNWSSVFSWKYDRNGGCFSGLFTPCGADMFIDAELSQGQTNSLVHVDNWITYETPGRVTPDLLLVNGNGATTFGSICDTDECAYPNQILYGNQ